MAEIPKTIQIGPFSYQVRHSFEHIAKARAEDGSAGVMYGRHYWYTLEIHIDPGAPVGLQREALLHEVRHGVWHALKISDDEKLSEEECVNRETPLLLDTLRRNPDMVKFLTEAD